MKIEVGIDFFTPFHEFFYVVSNLVITLVPYFHETITPYSTIIRVCCCFKITSKFFSSQLPPPHTNYLKFSCHKSESKSPFSYIFTYFIICPTEVSSAVTN